MDLMCLFVCTGLKFILVQPDFNKILKMVLIFKVQSDFNIYFLFFADIDQHTNPPELPIFGDPFTEIALDLVFPKGNPIFLLNGKKLKLLQPLDRDEENLSHIVFQVSK